MSSSDLRIVLWGRPHLLQMALGELDGLGIVRSVSTLAAALAAVSGGGEVLVLEAAHWNEVDPVSAEKLEHCREVKGLKVVLLVETEGPFERGHALDGVIRVGARAGARRLFSSFLAQARASRAGARGGSGAESAQRRGCVMVLDDDPLVARITSTILEDNGFRVVYVSEPLQFQRRVQEEGPDVVLVDYYMPALRGDYLIEIYRGAGVNVPMVLYSSASEALLQEAAQKSGAAGYLRKSSPGSVLVQTIDRFLSSRTAG